MRKKYFMTLEEANAIMKYNGGNLDLHNNKEVMGLPDGLVVEGDLAISDTLIEHLPNGLVVKGRFFAECCELKDIPDDIVVKGAFVIDNSNVERLPNNMTFDCLHICGTKIKELPNNCVIYRGLAFWDTKIEKLPSNIFIGGDIFCDKDIAHKIFPSGWKRDEHSLFKTGVIVKNGEKRWLKNIECVDNKHLFWRDISWGFERFSGAFPVSEIHELGYYKHYINADNREKSVVTDGMRYVITDDFANGIECIALDEKNGGYAWRYLEEHRKDEV